ncbi:MAG: roadblock/LC7 domain-containing protein [Candidatus Hodarchaeales archaeon]
MLTTVPRIKAAALVSPEGLPISSKLPLNTNETRIAAIISVFHTLTNYFVAEMSENKYELLVIKGSDGYLIIFEIAHDLLLLVSMDKDINIESIWPDVMRGFPPPSRGTPPKPSGDAGSAFVDDKY